MKIEKQYSPSKINWVLLPELLSSFIQSIPQDELFEKDEKKYSPKLRFEVCTLDEKYECHLKEEFLQMTEALNDSILKVVATIDCYTLPATMNPYKVHPYFFQLEWFQTKCSITIERNTFINASEQVKKFEKTLILKKGDTQKSINAEIVGIRKLKRTAFIAHSFDTRGEGYAFNMTKFLNHLNFEILTGAGYSPERVSAKVKRRLAGQEIVIAIVSEKLDNTWLIQEATSADSLQKPLFLCIEEGVNILPGILGDHEYINFPKGYIAQAFAPILEGLRELGFTFL